MNTNVINNFSKLKVSFLFLPLFLIITIVLFLYSKDSLNTDKYVQIQKDCFFYINHYLGQFPTLEYNITQLGDTVILLSFLIIFIIYTPKIWESLLSSSVISFIVCYTFKRIFFVPRPAKAFDTDSFIIIGKKAVGYSSLPSGHSITAFTILTVVLFAFMPKKSPNKVLWTFIIITIGLMVAFSRVGVGAHHPLDVIIGSIIGYSSGLIGILINQKYNIWTWVNYKKYYPIFILLTLVFSIIVITKIISENLIVYYLALICLFVSLYKVTYAYVKK